MHTRAHTSVSLERVLPAHHGAASAGRLPGGFPALGGPHWQTRGHTALGEGCWPLPGSLTLTGLLPLVTWLCRFSWWNWELVIQIHRSEFVPLGTVDPGAEPSLGAVLGAAGCGAASVPPPTQCQELHPQRDSHRCPQTSPSVPWNGFPLGESPGLARFLEGHLHPATVSSACRPGMPPAGPLQRAVTCFFLFVLLSLHHMC